MRRMADERWAKQSCSEGVMGILSTVVNAARRMNERPKVGRMIVPRKEDSVRDYPSAGLTPSRLAAVLREADDGSLATAMQLFEEMEEKDAHLYSVAHTRRLALTGLPWEVVSATELQPRGDRAAADEAADEAADYCREVLGAVESFDEALQYLSLAVGRNIAVAEIVWDVVGDRLQPVEFAPVDFVRLAFDPFNRLRILTEDQPREGIEPPENKFIVHTPHGVSGHPQRGGLLRVTAMLYLAKNLSLKDWMIFAEVFGMPVRIARYEPTASAEEKRELLTMLESLGSNAAGIFSRAIDLQIVEASRGTMGPPYEKLVDFINREISKAWLGQTLTTDISGQRGALAATLVHDEVRQDILADDMRKEARTIRRDLLGPMTRVRFGAGVAVPHFRRRPQRNHRAKELADLLDVAVNRLGLPVPQGWTHDALGLPKAPDSEPALGGGAR
jgi:phage gp29-like protein